MTKQRPDLSNAQKIIGDEITKFCSYVRHNIERDRLEEIPNNMDGLKKALEMNEIIERTLFFRQASDALTILSNVANKVETACDSIMEELGNNLTRNDPKPPQMPKGPAAGLGSSE